MPTAMAMHVAGDLDSAYGNPSDDPSRRPGKYQISSLTLTGAHLFVKWPAFREANGVILS